MKRITQFMPILDWLPNYDRKNWLKGDLSAGLTVGVMLIPQGMAYALIAGMPPIYGLYAALVPLVIYGLFGTSKQLAVGPVALMSLLVAASVGEMSAGGTQEYITLAITLSLLVGVLQLVMGIARMGFLVNFLSHPVLSGFASAAALVIGMNQIKHLLGVDIARSNHINEIVMAVFEQVGNINFITFAIALACILIIIAVKKWGKGIPAPLVVVVLSTTVVWFFDLQNYGVKITGDIPSGLPKPGFTLPSFELIKEMAPMAVTIALIGFMESIAMVKNLATKNKYEVDANQELIALGTANIFGAFFKAYPAAGGFARSAVNNQAGAKTPLAGILSAGLIALTLLFLTPLFYYMPNAVLAAIIVVAIVGLIDIKEAKFLWKVKKTDFALFMITAIATLVIGIEEGILIGVVVSLILVVQRSTVPHAAIMGRLPDSRAFRNIKRYPEAQIVKGAPVLRIDASLYFANVAFLKDQIRELENLPGGYEALVFDAYPVNAIDASAAHALKEIAEELKNQGKWLIFSGVKGPVMDVLKKAGIVDIVGKDNFFLQIHDAVDSLCGIPELNGADGLVCAEDEVTEGN